MQEVLQYEASYGGAFWIVIAVAGLIYLYTNLSFASNGNKKSITRGEDIYRNYCGKTIGGAFGLFSSFFCYISFVVMVGGANSTLSQQWGVPNGVGAVILSALVIMTVLFGLNGIIKALSAIGPIIIVCLLAVALYSCAFPTLGFEAGAEKISQNAIEIEQIGGGNPILSGMSYGGFVVLWFASFLAEIGANNNLRKVQIGIFISALFIFGAAALCCIALISNIDILFFADIPAAILANRISPFAGTIFSFVIFIGIYSSATPLLWSGIQNIPSPTKRSKQIAVVIAGTIGCFIACFVPYGPLLNVAYGVNGYIGFILIAIMVFHDLRSFLSNKRLSSK